MIDGWMDGWMVMDRCLCAQGQARLVRHLQKQNLECEDEEFLPALFSPPRDGLTAGGTVQRLGRRFSRRPATTATAAATTPAPKEQ
jgi:hypothetical protein